VDLLDATGVKQPCQLRRILYLQYTNPCAYPPLLHSCEILARRGWEVLLLGRHSLGFETSRPPDFPGVRFQYLPYYASGWKQKLQYLWFSLWCLWWARRYRPAWIYASDLSSCLPALLVHTLWGTRIIYHEHDSPAPAGEKGRLSLSARIFLWARRKIAGIAQFCIIPNEKRVEAFRAQTGTAREVKVVWNTPLRNEVSPPKAPAQGRLKLLYHGSIGPARLPLAVIHALKKIGYPVTLRVAGYETLSSLGYVAQLERTARELGIGECLEFVGFLPQRSDLMDHCQSCDVGLALVPQSVRDPNLVHLFGASNKAFDYMSAGLALLIPQMPGWEALLPYGVACDPLDADSIAAGIRYYCENPAQMRAMGERGRQRILEQWNYEKDFGPVLDVMES